MNFFLSYVQFCSAHDFQPTVYIAYTVKVMASPSIEPMTKANDQDSMQCAKADKPQLRYEVEHTCAMFKTHASWAATYRDPP